MYGTLALQPKALDSYRSVVGDAAVDEVRRLAEPLRGLRVLNLSVTGFGTGVAELLNASVPLLADAGLDCHWQVVRPTDESAAENKALYRALAGVSDEWSPEMEDVWLRYSATNADLLTEQFDVVIVHDPQTAGIRSFAAERTRSHTRWVLHSHLDLSSATGRAWDLLRRHIDGYNAVVFDADAFVHPALSDVPITVIRPAIDPLGPRNMELDQEAIQTILGRSCVDPDRPLVCQLSPCDPGSDMQGAIDVHDRVRRVVPDLQLVLITSSPPDDPASIAYFDATVRKSMEYSDAHILRGVSEVGNVEMNAFQRASNVVIQKGLRKGFGIWISDAQWKERPVVVARAGGLAQVVQDGVTGYLAEGVDDFADRVAGLLRAPDEARRMGEAGRRHVEQNFLVTRFVADELRLLTDLAKRAP